MPSKKLPVSKALTTLDRAAPDSTSRLPDYLRFPLLVTLSLTVSSLSYSLASEYIAGDFASASRRLNNPWEVLGLLAWRASELAVGWYSGYDGIDLASLTLLSHLPPLYLLATFYSIRPSTVITSLVIDILTTYIPFRLLRPLAPTHNPSAAARTSIDRMIVDDVYVRIWTTLLAASIYGIVIYGSYRAWLPIFLIQHFEGIKDLSQAHSLGYIAVLLGILPVGHAAREFIFTPSSSSRASSLNIKDSLDKLATVTARQKITRFIWGFEPRTKTVIERTGTLILVSGFNTWFQTFMTVEGVESLGAVGWSGVWATAAVLTGLMFWWVGDV